MGPMLLIAFAVGLTSHQQSGPCLTAERATRGVVFCSPKKVSFVLAGRTTDGRYSIYDYRYRFLPHAGGVMHGGQRLIVFRGERYVGNYMLPPNVGIEVKGRQVVLKGSEDKEPVLLDFSRGPPNRVVIDGEVEIFDAE